MRRCIVLLAAFLMAGNTHAQDFYGRFGLSYGIPMAGQTMDGTATPVSGSTTVTTVDTNSYTAFNIRKASFGSGLWATVGGGYMFNDNFGIDVAAHMGVANQKYTYNANNVLVGNIPNNVSIVQQAEFPVLLVPSLVIKTNVKKLKLYNRLGIVLPLSTNIIQDQIYQNLPGLGAVQVEDYTFRISNSFSVGFSGSCGLEWSRNERMKIWVEGSFLSLAVFAREAELIDVSVDGQSGYLSFIPEEQRKITYSANYNAISGDFYHQPTFSQPFSSFSIAAGVSVRMEAGNSKGGNGRGMKNYRNR